MEAHSREKFRVKTTRFSMEKWNLIFKLWNILEKGSKMLFLISLMVGDGLSCPASEPVR